MPFELRLPAKKPLALGNMSKEDLNLELQKGIDSLNDGKSYSADEVDSYFSKEYGI